MIMKSYMLSLNSFWVLLVNYVKLGQWVFYRSR